MKNNLCIAIRFHVGRYHGAGAWPPAPGRVFQALLAGAARGRKVQPQDEQALQWLEQLKSPVIATPPAHQGQAVTYYVPNNDLDTVGGNPQELAKLRTAKILRPYLFDPQQPLLFVWQFDDQASHRHHAERICMMSQQIYQLGQGIDMAWARAWCLTTALARQQLAVYPGTVHQPHHQGRGVALACPHLGTLASLQHRHTLMLTRFSGTHKLRSFSQPAKASFGKVFYQATSHRLLFDIRSTSTARNFLAYPPEHTAKLTALIRHQTAAHLAKALPQQSHEVEAVFIGRGAGERDKARRVKIIPLPSIGHRHADFGIRRIFVEIPDQSPLSKEDIRWAMMQGRYELSEHSWQLLPAHTTTMLHHYGISLATPQHQHKSFASWRSITPLALHRGKAKTSAAARMKEHQRAQAWVKQSLRHAGIIAEPIEVQLQREPWTAKGSPAGSFASSSRFSSQALYHVRITFNQAISGPIVLGHGRYLGLGLMSPIPQHQPALFSFPLPQHLTISAAESLALVRHVRRALMSLAKTKQGRVHPLFSGHNRDGSPAQSGHHRHVFIAASDDNGDGLINRIIVAAPWICDRMSHENWSDRTKFSTIVKQLKTLRAGQLGVLHLPHARHLHDDDLLVRLSTVWTSQSWYHPTAHPRRRHDPKLFVINDVTTECHRRGLPKPQVELLNMHVGPKGGNLKAFLRLKFARSVRGPLLLGRKSHIGQGLFYAADQTSQSPHPIKPRMI